MILSSCSACANGSFVLRLPVTEEEFSLSDEEEEEEYLLVEFKSNNEASFLNSEIYDHC
jgi:hypothetical protein